MQVLCWYLRSWNLVYKICQKRTQLFPLSLGISISCHLQLSEMPSSNFCAGSIDTTPTAESGPTLFTFDFIMHGQHRQCQCQWYIVPATTNELISCLPANITLKNFDYFGFSKTLPKHHIVIGKSTMFQRPRTRVDHGTASQQLLASIFPSTEFFMRGGGKPGVFSGADAALTFVFMAGSFVFKLFNIIVSKFAKLSDVSVWQVPSKVTINNETI